MQNPATAESMVGQAWKVRSGCYLEYRTLSNGQKLIRNGGELRPTRVMEELCPRDRKKIILAPQNPGKQRELASLRPLGEGGKMAYTSPMEIKLISLFVHGKEIKILYLYMKNNSQM